MRAAAPLTAHPWRLEEPPPPLSAGPPLVLALDRRDALRATPRQTLIDSLAPGERQRLAALRLPAAQERFLLARAALRRLLGASLAQDPVAVPIETGPHGKPRCPAGPPFNLSHSGDLILLALHPSRPVGVDVEKARPALDWRPIARRMLPPPQCLVLEALAAAEGPAAAADGFLQAWCHLEAGLKARGLGLAGRHPPARGARDQDPPLQHWPVVVPPGYRAAVALMDHPAAGAGACPPDPRG
jgi:4'-phosphopantetheinyl transferase